MSILHSNLDVLQVIKRLEGVEPHDLHVYVVHSLDEIDCFTTKEANDGVGKSTKGVGAGAEGGGEVLMMLSRVGVSCLSGRIAGGW